VSSIQHFQAFTITGKGLVNRIITDVEVFEAFDPESPPSPLPAGVKAKALWDTGATRSAISPDIATKLNLTATGATDVRHASGVTRRPTHLVNFGLPHGVLVAGILASEFTAELQGFEVIVGMDVICSGDFAITNVSGQSRISFRTPSCEAIDYVQEATRIRFGGTRPNDPCPCGSGKKYKKCHRP
jgi:hypothetical protein